MAEAPTTPARTWADVLLYGAGAVVFGAAAYLGGREVIFMARRGLVVGPRTSRDGRGIVLGVPQTLADAAALKLDVYALGRALSSEHGQDAATVQTAVAWAIANKARAAGRGLFDQLTRQFRQDGTQGPAHHLFGGQAAGGVARYASTALDPREREIQISRSVIGGTVPDPTRGATNFFSPSGQRAANARDPARNKTPEALLASWIAKGLSVRAVAGVDSDLVTFLG